jgi:hypothetical protein
MADTGSALGGRMSITPEDTHDKIRRLLQRSFSVLSELDEHRREEIGKSIERATLTIVLVSSVVILLLNALYFLPSQRFKELWNPSPQSLGLSPIERVLLMFGLIATFIVGFALLALLMMAVIKIGSILSDAFKTLYYRGFIFPAKAAARGIVYGILHSRFWNYLFDRGRKYGQKYVLPVALAKIEPETDRRIAESSIEELPPEAYANEELCTAIVQRYGNILDGIEYLVFFLFIAFIILLFVLIPVHWWSPTISDLILCVFFAATLISIPFIWGCLQPIWARFSAWAQCRNQLRQKRELEETAKNIQISLSDQLQTGIERLRSLYTDEFQKTREAIEEREQALRRLQHLAEQPNMDEETLRSVMWLVEFTLDQRRKEDAELQKQQTRSDRSFDRKLNFGSGFVYFILGVITSVIVTLLLR